MTGHDGSGQMESQRLLVIVSSATVLVSKLKV